MKEDLTPDKLKTTLQTVTVSGRLYRVAEGDLLISEDRFADYAAERLGQKALPALDVPSRGGTSKLLGIGDNNRLMRWAPGVVLSYFIRRETFSDNEYRDVRSNLDAATKAWMDTCGVEFRHMVELDADSAARTDQKPLFDVQKIDAGGSFIAAAFFPNDPPEKRTLLVDPSYFAADLRFDRVGVFRHELGHVLGFRHEHIRSEAPPSCPKESLQHTIEIGDYDPQSVMHYFCGNVGSSELAITAVDQDGARRLYGPALSGFELVRA